MCSSDLAMDDLAHRVYTTCVRVPKGRFPFLGRPPFSACAAEDMDGRAIRYHSFYARLSITRELMRADYAHNLSSDPRLAWRAALYGEIGDVLAEVAVKTPGAPPRWQLAGPTPVRSEEVVIDLLRASSNHDVPTLVERALRLGGPRTQSRLCVILEAVIGAPAAPEAEEEATDDGDLLERGAVRATVLEAWRALPPDEQALLRLLAEGRTYDEVCAALPRYAHKVAVNRALERIGDVFVGRLCARLGVERAALPPKALLERVLDVLEQLEPGGGDGA